MTTEARPRGYEADHAAAATVVNACGRLPSEHGNFVREVLDHIGDKWSTLVIGNLHDGPKRYSLLHQLVPGISQRMLTLTLKQLTDDGLILRTAYAEVPPRVEYSLTPLGESLLDSVVSLIRWASTNYESVRENRERAAAESVARIRNRPARQAR